MQTAARDRARSREESGEVFTRDATIERQSIDAEARTVEVSFSSQAAVRDRFFGPPTTLLHEEKAVDLSVLRTMGAALLNHDPSIESIVGRIESVSVDEKSRKGRATIKFDDDDVGNRAFAKVQSGSLRGVSVRFSVDKAQLVGEREEWTSPGGQTFKGGDRGLEVATRWTPREISLTPIPADVTVGVGRQEKKEKAMFSEKTLARLAVRGLSADGFASEEAAIAVLDKLDAAEARAAPPADPPPAPAAPPAQNPDLAAAALKAKGEARAKVVAFQDLAARIGDPAKAVEWFDKDRDVDDVRTEVIEVLSRRNPTPAGPPLERGHDEIDKVREVCYGAMLLRGRIKYERPKDFQEEIPAGIRSSEIARMMLAARGIVLPRFARPIDYVLRALSHTSGDFPTLLSNVANKSMQQGFMEAATTYQRWTVAGTAPDFKIGSRPALGEIQDFELVPDGMPLPESTISETGENVQLQTYGRKFVIGRQAWMNDDQGAFTRIPLLFGNAGARTINKAVYDHLTSAAGIGPTMAEDSIALFATTHPSGANYITGAGTTLQTSQLAVGKANMRRQKGITASGHPGAVTPSSARLNISPRILLVPATLEQTADAIVNGIYFPTTAATAQTAYDRSLEVLVEALLDDATNGTTAWYLVADPSTTDTVEVTRLEGQSGPEFMQLDTGDQLGFAWAGFVDYGTRALQHRGLFRSKGAA